jgi:hypothetical protein
MKRVIVLALGAVVIFGCARQRMPVQSINIDCKNLILETQLSSYEITANSDPVQVPVVTLHRDTLWGFEEAFKELKAMLSDEIPINFKRAVFLTENAYLGNAIDYRDFNQVVAFDASLCNDIKGYFRLKDYHHWKDSSNIALNEAIFSFMTKPLLFSEKLPIRIHSPFVYNFNDCFGDSDWTNTFVLKNMLTHKGNCRSLTFMYKILADELGTQAALALAPNHIYIKQKCQKYLTYNTELTSGLNPIDGWVMAVNYVPLETVQNGAYLKALTEKA